MVVTLVGIVTDDSDVHPPKLFPPIIVTLVGIITDTSAAHWENA